MKSILDPFFGFLRSVIDFFYPPFRKYMTLQFFRYGATGVMNLVFDWTMYFVIYNFVLHKQMVHLGFVTISSHIASLGIKMPIVLLSGFMMQKHITFSSSQTKGRVQLFRYMVVFMINLLINYAGLKLLVDQFHFYATPSNMIVSILTIFVSYFSQKHFIFKTGTKKPVHDYVDEVEKVINSELLDQK